MAKEERKKVAGGGAVIAFQGLTLTLSGEKKVAAVLRQLKDSFKDGVYC